MSVQTLGDWMVLLTEHVMASSLEVMWVYLTGLKWDNATAWKMEGSTARWTAMPPVRLKAVQSELAQVALMVVMMDNSQVALLVVTMGKSWALRRVEK